jgi:hypothetical protein
MNGRDIFEALGEVDDSFVTAAPPVREKKVISGPRRRAAIAALVAAMLLLLAGSVFAATNLGARLTDKKHNPDGTDSFTIEAPIEKLPMSFIGDKLKTIVSIRERFYGEKGVYFKVTSYESALDIIGCDVLRTVDMGYKETSVEINADTNERGISCITADVNYTGTGAVRIGTSYIIFTENYEGDDYTTTYIYDGNSGKGQGANWCEWTARGLQCLVIEDAPRTNGRTGMKCVVVNGSIVYELDLTYFMKYREEALEILSVWLQQL